MRLQAALKHRLKPLLFQDETRPRVIRAGLGRGLVMDLNRRNDLQKELGLWEAEAQRVYRVHVRRGSPVFDVGAGDGDSTLMLARLAAPGLAVAFEPDPLLADRLVRNLGLNAQLRNVRIIRAFVGAADRGDREVTLDAVVAAHPDWAPGFVKIDVEGAEMDVLTGMRRILHSAAPVVFVEVHGCDQDLGCRDFLTASGYNVHVVPPAWWRALYPEYRPMAVNRWLLGIPRGAGRDHPIEVRM